jgi:hypothetical protein
MRVAHDGVGVAVAVAVGVGVGVETVGPGVQAALATVRPIITAAVR